MWQKIYHLTTLSVVRWRQALPHCVQTPPPPVPRTPPSSRTEPLCLGDTPRFPAPTLWRLSFPSVSLWIGPPSLPYVSGNANTRSFVNVLFRLARCLQGSSMWQCVPGFPPFGRLSKTPLCDAYPFTHWWTALGLLPPLATVNIVGWTRVNCFSPAFTSLRYPPKSVTVRSYDKSLVNFWENCHTICYSGYTILHSHWQCTSFPVSPHPH